MPEGLCVRIRHERRPLDDLVQAGGAGERRVQVGDEALNRASRHEESNGDGKRNQQLRPAQFAVDNSRAADDKRRKHRAPLEEHNKRASDGGDAGGERRGSGSGLGPSVHVVEASRAVLEGEDFADPLHGVAHVLSDDALRGDGLLGRAPAHHPADRGDDQHDQDHEGSDRDGQNRALCGAKPSQRDGGHEHRRDRRRRRVREEHLDPVDVPRRTLAQLPTAGPLRGGRSLRGEAGVEEVPQARESRKRHEMTAELLEVAQHRLGQRQRDHRPDGRPQRERSGNAEHCDDEDRDPRELADDAQHGCEHERPEERGRLAQQPRDQLRSGGQLRSRHRVRLGKCGAHRRSPVPAARAAAAVG